MKLLLLRCPKCNQALSPGQDDRVIQCPNCHEAVSLDEDGLRLLPVQYVTPIQPRPEAWLPFWVYRGEVTIQVRETQGGHSAQDEARAFWAKTRFVYIPAWSCELAEARVLATELLKKQPLLMAVSAPEGATFPPVALAPEDGRKLVDLVIVSIEAGRRDWMEKLKYDLRLDSEALWLLPARRDGDEWSLLIKGL